MDENKKGVILDITKGVMVLTVDLTQPHGKLMAYGALAWAQENIEGWYLQQEILREQAQARKIIKPQMVVPNGDRKGAA